MFKEFYNENATFIAKKAWLDWFKDLEPSTFTINFNISKEEFDAEHTERDTIAGLFPDLKFFEKNLLKLESKEEEDLKVYSGSCGIRFIVDNPGYKRIFTVDYNSIYVVYPSYEKLENIEKEIKDLWSKLPKTKTKEPTVQTVGLVAYGDGEYYVIESKLNNQIINIEENYNDDFIPVNDDIIKFLDSRESGLVMLYGIQGSGKTSYIRHLCCTKEADYIVIPTSLTQKLGDPDFMSFLIGHSDSVFILEDCEQILLDRNINMFNGAISNILNMSDGLLSDIMNIKFICTFNADIGSIDKALLRKGRCYAKYEFKELNADKVGYLNKKYNLGISEIKPMTLAEIYNSDKTSYETKTKKKIGF